MLMDTITDQLLRGELRPGDKLPTELQLAARLGVSRNVVRETLKMLSALGAIEIRRGQGTFITSATSLATLNPLVLSLAVSQPSTHELAQLRFLVDAGTVEIACREITPEEIERLEAINGQIGEEGNVPEPDIDRILDLDFDFHQVLIEATRNSLIRRIGKTIYTLYRYSMKRGISIDPHRAYHDHRKIIEALRRKDPQLVRAAVAQTLSDWERLLET